MTASTFSTQLIEAGQNTQEFARQQQQTEGFQSHPWSVNPTPPMSPIVQGAGWALQQAGEGLQTLGFDEVELGQLNQAPTFQEASGSLANAISTITSEPYFNGVIADEAGGFDTITGHDLGGAMFDEHGPKASEILSATGTGITTVGGGIATYSALSTPATTIFGVSGVAVGGGVAAVGGVTILTGKIMGMFGLDEAGIEPEVITLPDASIRQSMSSYIESGGTFGPWPGTSFSSNPGMDPFQGQPDLLGVAT